MQRERRRHAVEARTQVRRGRRHAHHAPAVIPTMAPRRARARARTHTRLLARTRAHTRTRTHASPRSHARTHASPHSHTRTQRARRGRKLICVTQDRLFQRDRFRRARDHATVGVLDRRLLVLQAAARHHADHPARAVRAVLEQARHRRRRGRLAEDPFLGRQQPVGRRGSRRQRPRESRRANRSSPPSRPPSGPDCRFGSRSRPSRGARPDGRAPAAPRPPPGSRTVAARRPSR